MRKITAIPTLFLCFCLLASVAATATAAGKYDISTAGRVVAFGDVHGAYDDWTALLIELGVIDKSLNWSGGNTHLVSLGDLIDRGPGSRASTRLRESVAGGQPVALPDSLQGGSADPREPGEWPRSWSLPPCPPPHAPVSPLRRS